MSPDASDDEYRELFKVRRVTLAQTLSVPKQVTMNDAHLLEYAREVLRSVDPLGLRIVAHSPKVKDREVRRALRIPAKFVSEYRAHLVQKMLSPAVGSLVKTLGTVPSDVFKELQSLPAANTMIDREMKRFAPLAEGVAQIMDIAAARGITIDQFARKQLKDAARGKQGRFR